jgi:hypothetical protein
MRKARLGDAYMVVVAVLLDDVVMLEKPVMVDAAVPRH